MDDQLAPAVRMIVDDVAPVEAAVPGIHISRLDSGRNETELTLAGIEDIGLCVARFDFKVRSEGGIGSDELRLGLQLEDGGGSWNGASFGLDRLWAYRAGAEHSGAAGPHRDGLGSTWATFTVPLETASEAGLSDVVDGASSALVLDADTRPLRAIISDVVAEVQEQTFTVAQARRVGRELREASATLFRSADAEMPVVRSAYRITEQCLAVADDLDPIPTTSELADALGVSDRWVRSSFDRVYGVSVTAFFRARALHRAHRLLVAADPASTSVTEVAMACGFWHLGRFSGYYRAHFGGHPRSTLHRAP